MSRISTFCSWFNLVVLTALLTQIFLFLQKLEIYCNEVQEALMGGCICSVTNGHQYITALLKSACCFWHQSQTQTQPNTDSPPSYSSATIPGSDGTKQKHTDTGGRELGRKDSISRGRKRTNRTEPWSISGHSPLAQNLSLPNSFKSLSILNSNSHCRSVESGPSSFKSWVILSMSDSELSGYDGDVEHGTCHLTEVGESCDEAVDESQLLQSMPTYLVPVEVQQRLWFTVPLQHCIRLLEESMREGITTNW